MGKRKIDKQKAIVDKSSRRTVFWKRKRGLLKKAMELSMMCDQDIVLAIYDK